MDFSAGKHLRLPSFPHDEWYILQVWAIAKYLIVTRMMASWLILFVARSAVSFRICCDQNGNRSCIWDKNSAFRLFGADFFIWITILYQTEIELRRFQQSKIGSQFNIVIDSSIDYFRYVTNSKYVNGNYFSVLLLWRINYFDCQN